MVPYSITGDGYVRCTCTCSCGWCLHTVETTSTAPKWRYSDSYWYTPVTNWNQLPRAPKPWERWFDVFRTHAEPRPLRLCVTLPVWRHRITQHISEALRRRWKRRRFVQALLAL